MLYRGKSIVFAHGLPTLYTILNIGKFSAQAKLCFLLCSSLGLHYLCHSKIKQETDPREKEVHKKNVAAFPPLEPQELCSLCQHRTERHHRTPVQRRSRQLAAQADVHGGHTPSIFIIHYDHRTTETAGTGRHSPVARRSGLAGRYGRPRGALPRRPRDYRGMRPARIRYVLHRQCQVGPMP